MKSWWPMLIVGIAVLGNTSGSGQEAVIRPQEYALGFKNPFKGFAPRDWTDPNFQHPFRTFSGIYIRWNELENHESDTIDKIITVTNQKLAGFRERNVKGMPRVYLEWQDNQNFWPSDMTPQDYTSAQFNARVTRLVQRLAQVWDNDPRIAWIEMGIIGDFGEHWSPRPSAAQQQLLGDLFTQHFKYKKVMARYPADFQSYQFGIYWDSFANGNEEYVAQGIEQLGDKWKIAVFNGEVAYNWGTPPGANPNETLNVAANRDRLLDYIRRYHNVGLSWVSGFNTSDPTTMANAHTVQKAFGYRFVIREMRYPTSVPFQGTIATTFTVQNIGSALMYYNWPVELSLLSTATRQPVWRKEYRGVDLRTWWCGNDYDMTNNYYRIPAATYTVTGSFTLPPTVSTGVYYLALAVLDPSNMQPNLRFAIRNYFTGGRHPIGKIGVGVPVSDPTIPESEFNDLFADTTIVYGTHSFIPPTGVTAVAISSRQVLLDWQNNWPWATASVIERSTGIGGAFTVLATVSSSTISYLDHTVSPDTLYRYRMRVAVSTQYSAYSSEAIVRTPTGGNGLPWYSLTTTVVPPGAGSVVPSSGTFPAGTLVTVTAQPNPSYVFSHWVGDATGTTTTITVTMDRDRWLTAHFSSVPENQPPTVTMTHPAHGSTYTAPANIALVATATDPDGFVSLVRFYHGTTLLGQDSTSPYDHTWTNVSSGTYQLRAVAQDNAGATSTSTVVTVTVLSSSTPAVWYTLTTQAHPAAGGTISPASGTYLAGSQITVTATPNPNYVFVNWSGDATGTTPSITITMDAHKTLTANFTYTPPVNSSPSVVITSPADGTVYTSPASISISATASDSDGSVVVVRFYSGTTLLGADSTSPYEYTWTNVGVGSYILSAQAEDNQGTVSVSGPIGITVTPAPVVTYSLTVTVTPSGGGTVSQSPIGTMFSSGTVVTLAAVPNAGYIFGGWSGAVTSTAATISVVMDANKSVTATFQEIAQIPQPPVLQPGEVRVVGGPNGYVSISKRDSVTILFHAKKTGPVHVRVYSVRAQVVWEDIINASPDSLSVLKWDPRNLQRENVASGIYIIHVNGAGIDWKRRVALVN